MVKDDVLKILRAQNGQVISGGTLSKLCGVSRTAVWKAVNALIKEGHSVTVLPNTGYIYNGAGDMLLAEEIVSRLTAKTLGRTLHIFDELDSTNTYLKTHAESCAEGCVALADRQTAGKGRLGRSFYSPGGEGIYMSIFLTPSLPLSDVHFLTLTAAVATALAIESVCGVKPGIKWVNDLFLDGKKICGILTEASVDAELGALHYAIVGIGINTSNGTFPEELASVAGSLAAAGKPFTRNMLIGEILNRFEELYLSLSTEEGKKTVLALYKERLFVLGRTVKVITPTASYDATAKDLDGDGHLIVTRSDGTETALVAGEISIKL